MEKHKTPSLQNLTNHNISKPSKRFNPVLQALGAPHIESFNYVFDHSLNMALHNMEPMKFTLPVNGENIRWKIENCVLHPPEVYNSIVPIKATKIFPTECRQRGASYKGRLTGVLNWWVNDLPKQTLQINFGDIPVMIKSSMCHLAKMSPSELIVHGEDEDIWGGYFVIKGNERLIRMLIQTRANYPLALQRGSWRMRGNQFSELGVYVHCVAGDLRTTNNVLHFVNDGSAKLMFSLEKSLYFVPMILILKSLLDVTDEFIFQQLMLGCEKDLYYQSCVVTMLRKLHDDGIHNYIEARNYLGKTFSIKIRNIDESVTSIEVCDILFRQCIAIHLNDPKDKFHFICQMSRKLYSVAQNKCKLESADAVMMQEVQLGGFLYQQYIMERLEIWSRTVKSIIIKRTHNESKLYKLSEHDFLKFARNCTLESSLETFLATGNVSTITGMGLSQDKGLTIVAENINRMRYMSHFRAVHRGSFFVTMRTTDARQLLPDAWGFICPVHTPDGTPCGLLNHLTRHCQIVTRPCDTSKIPDLLVSLGMTPLGLGSGIKATGHYFVTLDGKVLGVVSHELGPTLVHKMRLLKATGERVPEMLEIVLVPHEEGIVGQYPGIFLFSTVSRMMRPVMQLASRQIEMIGTFEQVYLNIAVTPSEIIPGVTTHVEISETTFLSNLACLIPMPDCNQSPRNMYQCQMGKQSMGTPVHTWHLQSDCKLYRLQTPSSPLFRPIMYDTVDLDTHAMGINAVVAVISYTGYDMEDAMIINKSSYERGLAHGSIYKSEFITLEPGSYFARDPDKPQLVEKLDVDGLPYVGSILEANDPLCCYFDQARSCYQVKKYHGKEKVHVDHVKQCGTPIVNNKPQPRKACITFRVPRNPTVGDKFASRAGQKGICSQKWPAEDLPFTESGIVPDIVFNPHGFPSRMTIAMMVELMAGKTAAVHGLVHDATPFRFSEEDTAIDYFGKLLKEAGYNYHGTERMYSGIDGREMKADIFFGIVYYQRLRHMVSDKWQVRSTGPVDMVTRQPLKGRRRGGGVRFGEMERDALISHGASFLLQDRLLHCSDKNVHPICRDCGSILSTIVASRNSRDVSGKEIKPFCQACGEQSKVEQLEVPHVLRLLAAQFAAVNIKVKFDISQPAIK